MSETLKPSLDMPVRAIFPVGEPGRIATLVNQNRAERLAALAHVDNEVIAVNPYIYSPFNLEVGKKSNLGVFADCAAVRDDKAQARTTAEYWRGHSRTAVLTRALISDVAGNIYRDIDIKGAGFMSSVDGVFEPKRPGIYAPGEKPTHFGLLDKNWALRDYVLTEDLHNRGLRTNRTVAIIKLNELICNGQKLAVDTLKKDGVISQDFEPAIQVRAFGTHDRLFSIDYENGQVLFEDAKKLVADELDNQGMTDLEFAEWFAAQIGSGLAIIHNSGIAHQYISDHNITLDARIMDIGSATELTPDKQEQELESAERCLARLAEFTSTPCPSRILRETYTSTYH